MPASLVEPTVGGLGCCDDRPRHPRKISGPERCAARMHGEGPLLVVAGPGSGKTYSIVLRALNVLLLERATAKEIVLCTFTEKAAFEMRDRLSISTLG
jgi:superfamily I DNA/RNA helicase